MTRPTPITPPDPQRGICPTCGMWAKLPSRSAIVRLTAQCRAQDEQLRAAERRAAAAAAQNDRLEAEIARLTEENAALQARG